MRISHIVLFHKETRKMQINGKPTVKIMMETI